MTSSSSASDNQSPDKTDKQGHISSWLNDAHDASESSSSSSLSPTDQRPKKRRRLDLDAESNSSQSVSTVKPYDSISAVSESTMLPSQPSSSVKLQDLTLPVTRHFSATHTHFSSCVQTLLEKALHFSQGRGIVTVAQMERITSSYPEQAKYLNNFATDEMAEARLALGREANEVGLAKMLDWVHNRHGYELENEWNKELHWPLLTECGNISIHSSSLVVKDIQRGAYMLQHFKPVTEGRGTMQSGSAVDYVIALEESLVIRQARLLLPDVYWEKTRSRTINFFDHATLYSQPVAISFETKSEDAKSAATQLLVWVQAHYKLLLKLMSFVEVADALPVLPLIMVRGSYWVLHLAECVPWAGSSSGWRVKVHHIGCFAITTDMLGLLKAVAVILLLMDYAQTSYRPWLEDIMRRVIDKGTIKTDA